MVCLTMHRGHHIHVMYQSRYGVLTNAVLLWLMKTMHHFAYAPHSKVCRVLVFVNFAAWGGL